MWRLLALAALLAAGEDADKDVALRSHFNDIDKDKDGHLSHDEMKELVDETGSHDALKKSDADKDGKLSFAEFKAHQELEDKEGHKEGHEGHQEEVDASGDAGGEENYGDNKEVMTEDEFKSMDKDQNGKLSFAEVESHVDSVPEAPMTKEEKEELKASFNEMDQNKDSHVSLEEFMEHAAESDKHMADGDMHPSSLAQEGMEYKGFDEVFSDEEQQEDHDGAEEDGDEEEDPKGGASLVEDGEDDLAEDDGEKFDEAADDAPAENEAALAEEDAKDEEKAT
jgi:Ca2+-binding EF-hand superfamily protein